MKINTENCISCGQCVEVCPVGAIDYCTTDNGYRRVEIDEAVCIGCGECLEVDCPGDAISE